MTNLTRLLAVALAVGPATVICQGSACAATQSGPAVASGSGAAPVGTVLPDFSAMVQKYGPAVVNITVTKKMSNADADDPFGPNSPFAPFFRGFPGFPRHGRNRLRCKAKARGSSPAPMD